MSKKRTSSCPCSSGLNYADCCQSYIEGCTPAPTAEALMRSRYTAYAQNNGAYLLESWHPSTRPQSLDLASNMKWIRLKIVNSSESSVEFVATCRIDGKAHNLHEVSRFVFEEGRWYYVDGEIDEN